MNLNLLLFLSILNLLTSCNGQKADQTKNKDQFNKQFASGDTVTALGSGIMVVYQDKKNSYWFGSWETGVYRYDGKTLINFTTKRSI